MTGSEGFECSLRAVFIARVFTAIAMIAVPVASYFFFGALTQDLWDWGSYLQGTYTGAFHDIPVLTALDIRVDARDFHTTIALPFFIWLYRLLPFESWLIVWHGVFLVLPALVFARGIREIYSDAEVPRDPWIEVLCIIAFLFSPVVSGNAQWPYHWHIPGIFFFSLAFYAYARGKLGWCFAFLALFAAHKEEFGLFAGCFALPILLDSRFSMKKRLGYAALVLIGGVAVYQWGAGQSNSSFKDRFGNLGNSPKEALVHLFVDPLRYLKAWSSWPSFKFMTFFFVCSFWFLARTRRVLLLALPCVPFLFLYGASDFWNMREFRHHYALPLQIGLFAVLVFGVLPSLVKESRDRYLGRVLFLAFITVSAVWAQDTPFRSLTTAIREYYEHRADRAFLTEIKKNPEDVICCENRLCTFVSGRPLIVFASECLKGSKLVAESSPARVGLLMHRYTPLKDSEPGAPVKGRIRIPKVWDYSSDYMTFSWVTPEKF